MNADPYGRQGIFKKLRELGAQSQGAPMQPQSWDTGEAPDPMMAQQPYRPPALPREHKETGMPSVGASPIATYDQEVRPGQMGSAENGSWDAASERKPVYEYNGMRYVGSLEWMPSWPKDLQPVDYVDVPIPGTEWRVT